MSDTEFLDHCRCLVRYWNAQDESDLVKLEGLVFSILCAIDGVGPFDPIDLVSNGVTINASTTLHERWYPQQPEPHTTGEKDE